MKRMPLLSTTVCLTLLFLLEVTAWAKELRISVPGKDFSTAYQTLEENKILLSVKDKNGKPVKGISEKDLELFLGTKRAKIVSVEPLEINKEVPLNLILVLDNSYSMRQRKAIEPLLTALQGFFDLLRPIDDVHIVVFNNKPGMQWKDRPLMVKDFRSRDKASLMNFIRAAYDSGLTDSTYLYEALVAGLRLASEIPPSSNKFLLVFSDGEDLNSSLGREDVLSLTKASSNLTSFAVDYMPDEKTDPFLTSLAQSTGGSIWKAGSASELIPIFKAFSSTLLHRYVVIFRPSAPPTGGLEVEPPELDLDALVLLDGRLLPPFIFFQAGKSEFPSSYKAFPTRAHAVFFDEKSLRGPRERHLNLLNIVGDRLKKNPSAWLRVVGCTSGEKYEKGLEALSLARAEKVRAYLKEIWDIDTSRIRIEARGLPERPAPEELLEGPAENQRVELMMETQAGPVVLTDLSVQEKGGSGVLEIRPKVEAPNGVASWDITIWDGTKTLASQKGTGDMQPFYLFPLADLGWEDLLRSERLEVILKVTDQNGDLLEAKAPVVKVRSVKNVAVRDFIEAPSASLSFEPAEISIEEITTIESSPMLNFVFFEAGSSQIPDRYVLFKGRADTDAFSFSNIAGAMEKHHHVLNIIGKRLRENPQASIRLVGCNADVLEEKGRIELSRERALAVRRYLEAVWGIPLSRMAVEARGLPALASPSRHEEGRAENRRVEILSESGEILDSIPSTYVEYTSSPQELKIKTKAAAGYGVAGWSITIKGADGRQLTVLSGTGDPPDPLTVGLKEIGLKRISGQEALSADIVLTDRRGNTYRQDAAARCKINFITTEARKAQRIGYRVQESYALILFDFGSDKISGRNQVIADRILERIKTLPRPELKIVGHTDTTGPEDVNMSLSERRARAVYTQLKARGMKAVDALTVTGVGPYDPLYDNALPEGRALNRTVNIYIEYSAVD
jgi:outer membrane protein OmpA-like peptidoglycan-associated protein